MLNLILWLAVWNKCSRFMTASCFNHPTEYISFFLAIIFVKFNISVTNDMNISYKTLNLVLLSLSQRKKSVVPTPIVLFTPHVPEFFWNSRHNFTDIELKFCICCPNKSPNLKTLAQKIRISSIYSHKIHGFGHYLSCLINNFLEG